MQITITNLIGYTKTYYVHKNLLQNKSKYFLALKSFQEGQENHVVVERMSHDAFGTIVCWLYTGRIKTDFEDDMLFWTLITAWLAADRLMIDKCKNMVMDTLREHHESRPITLDNLLVIQKLDYDIASPLICYLVDQASYDHISGAADDVCSARESCIEALESRLRVKLVLGIVEEARMWRVAAEGNEVAPEDPAGLKGCQYHDHTQGEKCYLVTG